MLPRPVNRLKNSRFLGSALIGGVVIAIAACGAGSQPSAQSASSPSAGTATSPGATLPGFAASLTFTGSLTGTTTQSMSPKNFIASDCGGGIISVGVTLNGHDYVLGVINGNYGGPKTYTLDGANSIVLVAFDDVQYGGATVYTAKSGQMTYKSEKSITIDAELAGPVVGPSAGLSAHISGSASCSS